LSISYTPQIIGPASKPTDSWIKQDRKMKGEHFQDNLELSRMSIENKLFYSHLHMYPFFYYHSHLLDASRPANWGKISVLEHHLPYFEWLMWIDIDAFCVYRVSFPLQFV
jgi:hypothetical protein